MAGHQGGYARLRRAVPGHDKGWRQSRSNSLMEVFDRVFSSTRLTITAQ
jgi:hypothetical protein